MKITRETASYNDRRYGKPWVAKVDFSESAQGTYTFGEWVGHPGEEGLLEIEVQTHDILAFGQKDHRKPKNSVPEYYSVAEDGSLALLPGKAAAYKTWKASHETA